MVHEFLNDIIQIEFPEDQYIKVETKKSQICVHHTVSGNSDNGAIAVARYWKSDQQRIATPILIAASGKIFQLYSTKYYGGHIGVDKDLSRTFKKYNLPKRDLSKISIGIELLSWGGLKNIGGELYAAYGNKVECPVVHYPEKYRGFEYFEKYTDAQIESLRKLILYWHEIYGIPIDYNEDIWDVTPRALRGDPGLYVHTSYRFEKSDCHPQKELIEMFKSLKS